MPVNYSFKPLSEWLTTHFTVTLLAIGLLKYNQDTYQSGFKVKPLRPAVSRWSGHRSIYHISIHIKGQELKKSSTQISKRKRGHFSHKHTPCVLDQVQMHASEIHEGESLTQLTQDPESEGQSANCLILCAQHTQTQSCS